MCARWMIRGMECGREEEYRARPNVPSGETVSRGMGCLGGDLALRGPRARTCSCVGSVNPWSLGVSAFKIFIFASPLSSEETVMSSMAHPRATSCAVGAMS